MMSVMGVVAIVGAGKAYGLSLGKIFGRHGYDVALLSRSKSHVDELAETLASENINAKGFVADALDKSSLLSGLNEAKAHFGAINVLEYSPVANKTKPMSLFEADEVQLLDHFNSLLIGGSNAARAVLPDMLKAGSGSILFTTGLSALEAIASYGSYSVSGAALKRYVRLLSKEVADKGVYVGLLALGLVLRPNTPKNDPAHPDVIAEHAYELLQKRNSEINRYPESVSHDTILWNREYK
jgi:NAD(P)-dependent dehydrogenase (short-subunit alcohol dehydrogenase family)